MKKVKEFIDKLTDYIDLGIYYLGYILFIAGFCFSIKMINISINILEAGAGNVWQRDRMISNLAVSIIGVYFIKSYKKKDK